MCAQAVGEWQLWEERYCALQEMIGILSEQVPDDLARATTFRTLLSRLQAFAREQFCFLFNGFKPDAGAGYRLEPSLQFPAAFVLEGTLDQIGFDLTVIQDALHQRELADAKENGAMKRTLAVADWLAYLALLPAVRHGLLPYEEGEVTVLTYFQKSPRIRIVPYASVALVGVPYTALATYEAGGRSAVGNARDLLAIPHEVGHYVYRHGMVGDRRLQIELYRLLQGRPQWLLNWAEEIFADVYGCFIAGPVIARDFQDLVSDNDVALFVHDDGEHPTPALRPLIYCDALRILAETAAEEERETLEKFVVEAERQWKGVRGNRGEEQVRERRPIIDEAIRATCERLIRPQRVSIERQWSVLDGDLDSDKQYKDLYATFYNELVTKELFQRVEGSAESAAVGGEESGERAQPEPATPEEPPDLEESSPTPQEQLPLLRSMNWIRDGRAKQPPKEAPVLDTAETEEMVVAGEVPSTVEATATSEGVDCGCGPVDGGSGDNVMVIPVEIWTPVASMHGWATNGPDSPPNPRIT